MVDSDKGLRLVQGGQTHAVPFRDRRVEVRLATLDDVSWIMEQVPSLIDFARTRIPPFPKDPAKIRPAVQCLIQKHLFMIAKTYKNEPLGFIAGFVSPGFFNPDLLVLQETLWWVKPEARDGRAALMLLQAFVTWGETYTDWVSISLEDHSLIRPGHLEKHGFKLKEHTYLKEIVR